MKLSGKFLKTCTAISISFAFSATHSEILPDTSPDKSVAWVMSYFGPAQDLPNDSLHLAFSKDGLHWSALNGGRPVYQAPTTINNIVGSGHIRDPFILRKNDGKFVYIATDWTLAVNDANYWNRPSGRIFVADSDDLISFTNPRFLTLTTKLGATTNPHAWAPEAYYDPIRKQYAIVWSGNADRGYTYVSYTEDFVTLTNSTPELLFDPGYDEIDATITQYNGFNYLFYKDETGAGKDIQVAKSSGSALAAGTFSRISPNYLTRGTTQGTQQGTEGPLVIKMPGQNLWYLYADYYGKGGVFGAWSTTNLDADPSTWKRLTSGVEYELPSGVRHANTVRVTQAQLDALTSVPNQRRSLEPINLAGSSIRHRDNIGYVEVIASNSGAIDKADATFVVTPSLDTRKSGCVSFQSVNFPSSYLRHYNYRVVLNNNDNSAIFKADASFCPKSGLAGSGASFEAINFPGYFIRHSGTSLVLGLNDNSSSFKDDASFNWLAPWTPLVATGKRNSFTSANLTGNSIHVNNGVGYVDPIGTNSSAVDKASSTFVTTTGLDASKPQCVSFQSVSSSTQYLRHYAYQILMATNDNSNTFKADATFCPHEALSTGDISFTSSNYPDHFLRHRANNSLWVDVPDGTTSFNQDATFKVITPWAP